MAEFSIGDAAKAANVDRSTIYRQINNGTLSAAKNAKGKLVIDVSELQRVYPELQIATDVKPLQKQQIPQTAASATTQLEADNRVLQAQLDAKDHEAEDLRRQLRDEREQHRETKVEKARFLDMLEEAQKRIPALPSPADITAQPAEPLVKRGLWAWLRGK